MKKGLRTTQGFQYKKVKAPKNAYIDDFYVIMFNQVPLGQPLQTKEDVQKIFDWLNSIESEDCLKAKARSK
jgi:hypothetical protein